MLHKNILIEVCVQELKEQLAELIKRKGRKRKQIQTGSIIEFSVGVLQVAKSASATRIIAKKAYSSSSYKRA
jgi:hypothetical protein